MKISIISQQNLSIVTNETSASDLSELADIITTYTWSPYIFTESKRKASNFNGADLFAIDIDDGLSLNEAVKRLKLMKISALIGTTKSHQKDKNGVVCDRYRIIFPLKTPLTSKEQIRPLFEYVRNFFPTIDKACKDGARLFYPCQTVVIVFDFLDELEPSKALPLAQKSLDFIKQGAPEGGRNGPFIELVHDAIQQQWGLEEFWVLLQATGAPWMTEEQNRVKVEERYKNFKPKYLPRTPTNAATPAQNGKTEIVPVKFIPGLVKLWLEDNEVRCSYNGSIFIGSISLIIDDIARKIKLHYSSQNVRLPDDIVESYLIEWVEERRQAHKAIVAERLTAPTQGDGIGELKKFCAVLKTEYTTLDLAVMQHMIWQVKRKIMDLRTKHELMLILHGGQGVGKSTILRDHFLTPLGDLAYAAGDFKLLTDERQARIFSDHYVVLFDEMSGADKSDMERVKQLITSTTFKQRRMGTTRHDTLVMNTTCFGNTNKRLDQILRDTTGMRRFYELKLDPKEVLKKRWPLINDINFDIIWRGVDHKSEAPIEPFIEELYAYQKEYTDKTQLEALIEQGIIEIDDNAETSFHQIYDVLNSFSNYKWSVSALGKELRDLGVLKKRRSPGMFYPIKINVKRDGEF